MSNQEEVFMHDLYKFQVHTNMSGYPTLGIESICDPYGNIVLYPGSPSTHKLVDRYWELPSHMWYQPEDEDAYEKLWSLYSDEQTTKKLITIKPIYPDRPYIAEWAKPDPIKFDVMDPETSISVGSVDSSRKKLLNPQGEVIGRVKRDFSVSTFFIFVPFLEYTINTKFTFIIQGTPAAYFIGNRSGTECILDLSKDYEHKLDRRLAIVAGLFCIPQCVKTGARGLQPV